MGAWGEGGIWLKKWQRGRNVDVGTGGEGPLLVSSVLLCSSLRGCTPRRERGRGRRKGKGRGVPWTLPSRSPKGPASALLKARARKEAEMEVWGRPSSPLLVPHTPVLRRAAIPRGGSPGWGRQPWHSRLPTGEAAPAGMCLVFRESLLQGNPEPFPTPGHPQELGIGSVPQRVPGPRCRPTPSPPAERVAGELPALGLSCCPHLPAALADLASQSADPNVGVESLGGHVCPSKGSRAWGEAAQGDHGLSVPSAPRWMQR